MTPSLLSQPRSRVAAGNLWVPPSIGDISPRRRRRAPLQAFGGAGAFGSRFIASRAGATPIGIYGGRCRQWLKSDLGITIGTDPYGTGSTIQAVMLSGSAAAPIDFYLEIQTTGARGVATYKYGAAGSAGAMIESGVLTAATHACTGACSGITVNFPTGTYTAGDNYQGVVSTWADQTSFGNNATTPSSLTAPFYRLTNFAGGPSLAFSGVGTYLTTSSFVAATGNDTAFSVFLVAQAGGVAASRVLWGCGSTSLANPLYDLQVDSAGPNWGFSKKDDAGTSKTCSGGTADTNRHYFSLINDGQTQTFYIDGSLVSLTSSGDLNVGTATLDRMTIGARLQAAATIPLGCNVREVWVVTGTPSAIELAASHAYLATKI